MANHPSAPQPAYIEITLAPDSPDSGGGSIGTRFRVTLWETDADGVRSIGDLAELDTLMKARAYFSRSYRGVPVIDRTKGA